MKTRVHSRPRLGLGFSLLLGASVAGLLLLPAVNTPAATTLSFHLDLNTAALVANPAAPFSLDLQFSQGNGLSNTLTLSNFVFTGGAPAGAATTLGGASGDLGSSVVLRDSSPLNDLYQGFSGTTLGISFDISSTLNPSAGTPNLFTVSILGADLLPILTTSPGVGTAAETDYLVGVPIDDATTFASVRTYTSNVPGSTTPGVTVAASPVPEPSSLGILLVALSLGAAGQGLRTVRRRRGEGRSGAGG